MPPWYCVKWLTAKTILLRRGDLPKNTAGKMAGQHPLADPDQLDKCMGLGKAPETSPRYPLDIPPQEGSAHDELRRGQRPNFFFLSHPSSQVDIYNIYRKLPWLGSTPTSVFRVATHNYSFFCSPKFGNMDRPVFRTSWCCQVARGGIRK